MKNAMKNAPHKHADLIHAWADGAEIEYQTEYGAWLPTDPIWDESRKYRIKDPYRHLKEVAADLTKQIRFRNPDTGNYVDWQDAGFAWGWRYPPECYEVRDKPKTKVKMWQWIYRSTDESVYTTHEFFQYAPFLGSAEVIGKAEWTEIEVEE